MLGEKGNVGGFFFVYCVKKNVGVKNFQKKRIRVLKTVVFIAGKKNPATQKFFIRFSIENLIANISFYALSWPKFQ